MEYIIGIVLACAVGLFAATVGFDRDRAFYPTVLIVVAIYYVLFGVIGGSGHALIVEIAMATVFFITAVAGFKKSLLLVAAALLGHGVFDFFHHFFIHNPGVPVWWPGFCMAYDVTAGLWLALRLRKSA